MQKRGKVLDNDDFLPIRDTYPEHPMSKIIPNARTMGELRDKRNASNREKIEAMNKTFEEKKLRFQSEERPYILSEFNGPKPAVQSIIQRRENLKQEARKKLNLTNVNQDQKDEVKAPSLDFIEKPKIASKSILQDHRRQQMLNELKQMEHNVGHIADSYARMNKREDCALRVLSNMPPSKMTMQQLD